MFCTKCGFNLTEGAKFCPKCGNSIKSAADNAQAAEQPQASQQSQPTGQALQQEPVNSNKPPKKKIWPVVTAIVAVLVLLAGIGTYFAYPYISEMISPKKGAVSALKNATADLETLLVNAIDKGMQVNSSEKQNAKGSLKLEELNIAGIDYKSYVKADTINYDIDADVKTGNIGGTLSLSSGKAQSVIDLKYYFDGSSNLYFSLPKLFSNSFKTSMSVTGSGVLSGADTSQIMKSLSGSDIEKYKPAMQALVKKMTDVLDNMIDNGVYTKNKNKESVILKDSTVEANTYDIVFTKAVMEEAMMTAVDQIYTDSSISPYLTMLAIADETDKESLKTDIKNHIEMIGDVRIKVYIADKKFVKADFDASVIDGVDSGNISVTLPADKCMDFVYNSDGNIAELKLDASKDNTVFDVKADTEEGSFAMRFDTQISQNAAKINEISFDYNASGLQAKVKISGESASSEFTEMSVKESDFENAIDLNSATDEQMTQVGIDLVTNFAVLNEILSDEIYTMLQNSLFGGAY